MEEDNPPDPWKAYDIFGLGMDDDSWLSLYTTDRDFPSSTNISDTTTRKDHRSLLDNAFLEELNIEDDTETLRQWSGRDECSHVSQGEERDLCNEQYINHFQFSMVPTALPPAPPESANYLLNATCPAVPESHQNPPKSKRGYRRRPKVPIPCEHCDQTFSRQRDYNRHSKCHSKPFKCDLCEYRTGTKKMIKRHCRVHHTAYAIIEYGLLPERFPCIIKGCPATFAREDGVLKHLDNSHPGIREKPKTRKTGTQAAKQV